MQRMYFAHPVNSYNTSLELDIIKLVQEKLSGVDIENPNQPHHQEEYRDWKKRYEGHPTKSGMSYFYEMVLPTCDSVIAMPFLDGKFGAGVVGETAVFIKKNRMVWVVRFLDPQGKYFSVSSMSEHEQNYIITDNPHYVLSIEETRMRTWGRGEPYKTLVPFKQSHLI